MMRWRHARVTSAFPAAIHRISLVSIGRGCLLRQHPHQRQNSTRAKTSPITRVRLFPLVTGLLVQH
jgi:hypothetical protein